MQFKHFTSSAVALLLAGSAPFAPGVLPAAAQTANEDGVRIKLARFWRGNGQTLVDGVIGVPVRHADGQPSTVQVDLSVRDAAGNVLHQESWTDTISGRLLATARARGGTEVTRFVNFGVQPGQYTVSALVTRGTQRDSAKTTVQGFAEAPLISDPLLSSRIRSLGPNEEAGAAELKKGRLAIESGTRVTIVPTDPVLWYYLELYPVGQAVNEELEFSVTRAAGGAPLASTKRRIAVNERGGVDAARLPLQGLPPGEYVLTITAGANGRSERRQSAFTMGVMQEAPVVVSGAGGGTEAALLERYFAPAVRSDSAISHIIEALTLASPAEAVPASTNQMNAEGKRRFLARFWSRVPDPQPNTPKHELLEEYIGRVDFVSREYVEKDIGRSGVRTHRGRIYLKYGPPDAKQALPMTGNRAVEVWKYTRNRNLKFAFLDETGFSAFNLVYTTDPTELSLPDWVDRVKDVETVRLIVSF